MARTLFLAAILSVGFGAPALPQPAPPSPEEAAVLAVVDRFMQALAANDFARLSAMRFEGSVNFVEHPSDTGGTFVTRRVFTPDTLKPGNYRERYWDPIVHVRGRLAIVWAPYEFWLNGKTTHCGIDVFEMVKDGATWKIANLMWTVEPDACPALRPSDPGRLRPAS